MKGLKKKSEELRANFQNFPKEWENISQGPIPFPPCLVFSIKDRDVKFLWEHLGQSEDLSEKLGDIFLRVNLEFLGKERTAQGLINKTKDLTPQGMPFEPLFMLLAYGHLSQRYKTRILDSQKLKKEAKILDEDCTKKLRQAVTILRSIVEGRSTKRNFRLDTLDNSVQRNVQWLILRNYPHLLEELEDITRTTYKAPPNGYEERMISKFKDRRESTLAAGTLVAHNGVFQLIKTYAHSWGADKEACNLLGAWHIQAKPGTLKKARQRSLKRKSGTSHIKES